MIRATTSGVLNSYRTNLMQSFITQSTAMKNMLKPRNFHSYADDTASASRAYQIRRSLQRTGAQLGSSQTLTYKFESAWAALEHVVSDIDNGQSDSEWDKILRGLSDSTADARSALGKAMIKLGDDIIQSMNTKYGDNFVFAGADGLNVPFEIREDGHLYYRGVNVDTEVPKLLGETKVGQGTPIQVKLDANGNYVQDNTGTSYLRADSVEIMSEAEYKKATKLMAGSYNADGTPNTGGDYVILESKTTAVDPTAYAADPGAYTVLKNADGTLPTDANGNYIGIKDAIMTKDAYDASAPKALANGTNNLVEVNKDGVPTTGGGYYVVVNDAEAISQKDYEQAKSDLAKLDYMSKEGNYVDIGRGLQEDEDGNLIESSAFNQALQGINYLGYGVDEDGDPKNLVSMVRRMGEICTQFQNGEWTKDSPGWDELNRLANKFHEQAKELQNMHTDLDADAKALKNNNDLLTDKADTMKEQIHDLEDMDEAEAISSFIWAQYCYNAALKVGNSVLSESLMDYMS
jgi:flagellin-like hook-associated protein FlgL